MRDLPFMRVQKHNSNKQDEARPNRRRNEQFLQSESPASAEWDFHGHPCCGGFLCGKELSCLVEVTYLFRLRWTKYSNPEEKSGMTPPVPKCQGKTTCA